MVVRRVNSESQEDFLAYRCRLQSKSSIVIKDSHVFIPELEKSRCAIFIGRVEKSPEVVLMKLQYDRVDVVFFFQVCVVERLVSSLEMYTQLMLASHGVLLAPMAFESILRRLLDPEGAMMKSRRANARMRAWYYSL